MKHQHLIETLNQHWTDIYYALHYVHQENISHHAIRALQYIEKNEETSIGDVADHLKISHNTASEHIKRLIQKGFVVKQRSSRDERKVFVALTPEGSDVLFRHSSLNEEKLHKVLGNLNEDDMKTIEKGFQLLSEESKKCF